MEKKKQTMRFSDSELSVIKNTFCEQDELLKALRKFMLQLPMSEADKSLLEIIKNNKDVLAVVRKTFLPTIDGDAPFNQLIDLWMTIKIDDKTPENLYPILKARELLIGFLEHRLNCLEQNCDTEKIKLSSFIELTEDKDESYSNLLFRNTMIGHTEQQLQQILILAGQKDETVEETQKRLKANSAK